jgi:hypothetical protein
MYLYIDDALVSEAITPKELKDILKHLPADRSVHLLLDGPEAIMEAEGSPAAGYRITYTDKASGSAMTAPNHRLRPITLRHIMLDFLADRTTWRYRAGWGTQPVGYTPSQKARRLRIGALVGVYCLILGFGFVPLTQLNHLMIEYLHFIPACERLRPDVPVISYLQETRAGTGGTCIYDDYSTIPFAEAAGSVAAAIQAETLASAAAVLLTIVFMVVLLWVFVKIIQMQAGFSGKQKKG